MAARVRVELDERGVRELLTSPGVRRDLERRARAVEAAAKANAPVRSGAYRDSIETQMDETDRVVARVGSNVTYAMVVEAHSGTLLRALDAGA